MLIKLYRKEFGGLWGGGQNYGGGFFVFFRQMKGRGRKKEQGKGEKGKRTTDGKSAPQRWARSRCTPARKKKFGERKGGPRGKAGLGRLHEEERLRSKAQIDAQFNVRRDRKRKGPQGGPSRAHTWEK